MSTKQYLPSPPPHLCQIEYLTITFGILLGVGGSLAYTPSLVILGHYFRRRMGIVNGFVTAGSSLFTVFMPMLFQVLLDNYGLKVLFQVLSAMMSLLMVSEQYVTSHVHYVSDVNKIFYKPIILYKIRAN